MTEIVFRQRGDDLAAYTRDTALAMKRAEEAAPRHAAYATRKQLVEIIRRSFGKRWRVWNAAGFAKAIKVKRMGPGWWRVYSKAKYTRGRSEQVDLLWVFDVGPVVTSGAKGGVAIPIPGEAPIHQNGRRYMWPSEAARAGWQLDFAKIMGKDSSLILGRRSTREHWRPMWIWKQSVKLPKKYSLDAIHFFQTARMETFFLEAFDEEMAKLPRRRLAA